ncbi:MAG: tetratricopeptide repeat protein [bacterium]|nr:tetratricopeptide repeat protein [bacterium]
MYSKLLSWSRGVYLAGIVLALVLVVPTQWFPFQLAKVAVFAVLLLVCAVMFVAGGGLREVLRSHGFRGVLLVALIPLAYLLSWFFSVDRSVGLTGFGIETDTVLFSTLIFLAFALSFTFFRTLRTVRLLLAVVFWALLVAAVFQLVSIVFGQSIIPFATFADRSVNLIGKWNDLGILVGLLAVILLIRAELQTLSTVARISIGVLCAVLAILLGIINFELIWGFVLVSCVILGILRLLMQRGELPEGSSTHWMRRIPWFSIVGIGVSILFLFFGSTFNVHLTNLFPVSSLEVRPSYSSTLGIIDAARLTGQGGSSFERVLVGTGPNTFGQEWLLHKPQEVNQSAFWNLDFNVGFSTFTTALGSVGLVGLLAWLVPLFLILAALVRSVRLSVLKREDKIVTVTLSIASFFLLFSILLYVPSQNIILLAFVFAGATFGFLWRQGQSSLAAGEEPQTRLARIGVFSAGVVLLTLSLWVGVTSSKRLIAETYVGHGAAALSSGAVDQALADAARAQSVDPTGNASRLQLQATIAKLQQIASATSTPTQNVQQEFAALVQLGITAGQAAQAINPQDYRPTFGLAQLYDFLASLNVQGAAETASSTYMQAAAKNPTNPAIPLALARLAANQNNVGQTTQYLAQALTLKPNYTDAILLVVQLNVAQNDIPSAIKAATAATQTAPGVAPIWFELGLLYYSAGDATKATAALEQAVTIQKDYANAKYFLGLSYYLLGKTPDAITQFKDLAISNPDNAEVKLILGNLTSGRKPFDGATPPVTPTPQTRPTAPISQ